MKWIRSWGPSFLWMGVIFFFSSRHHVQVSDQEAINFIFFKTLHVLEYATLFLLNVRALHLSYPKEKIEQICVTAAALTIAYALADEIHQLYVPTREGRLRDVIIDGIGVLLAWIYLVKLLPKVPKKLRRWGRDWLKS